MTETSPKYNQPIAPFSAERLEALCRVLGETSEGLTGSDIGHILSKCKVPDIASQMTKWQRLYNAFVEFQNKHQVGNHVVMFIQRAMDPARYTNAPELFSTRRDALNSILSFSGIELMQDGKLKRVSAATNLPEALERANRFKAQLEHRHVHKDVLASCPTEIRDQNYFHAVFESMKGISAKVRKLSGFTTDGADLVDAAFALGNPVNPVLAINKLDTETLKGEQRGFSNLLKGLYGVIRNPLGHELKTEWTMTEQDALDIMSTISLVHRKLDGAQRFRP